MLLLWMGLNMLKQESLVMLLHNAERQSRQHVFSEIINIFDNFEDVIEVKNNLRDLGIIMSDNANFKAHIGHVCAKVKQKCGWILRTFSSRNSHLLKFLWKSLVQVNIDYCSQLYLPNQVSEMQQIENLQKWYTRKIPELKGLNYWERLHVLKMYSQES